MLFGKSMLVRDLMAFRGHTPEPTILRLVLYDTRRSQTNEIPLRFINLYGRPHVLYPASPSPEWVALATESGFVRWRIGSQEFTGTGAQVSDPVRIQREVLPPYVDKFGAERVSRWFGRDVGCMRLIEPPETTPYLRAVEALFDQSAPTYDRIVEGNRLDMHLRNVALEFLVKLFRPGQRVLELGCGTGLETIPLAQTGVDVVAVDISSNMLAQLERKARETSPTGRIETRKASISQLVDIVRDLGPGSFDGAFSHFGALNCEPDLRTVPSDLHELVRTGGRISLGVWNRTCLAEMTISTLGLRPARALGRLQSSVPVGRSRFGVPVYPHSPAEIGRLFGPRFSFEEAMGVSFFVPPYNLAGRFSRFPQFVSFLEMADRVMCRRPFFRYLGDHFLLGMRRR